MDGRLFRAGNTPTKVLLRGSTTQASTVASDHQDPMSAMTLTMATMQREITQLKEALEYSRIIQTGGKRT